jgi:hypothetical protein
MNLQSFVHQQEEKMVEQQTHKSSIESELNELRFQYTKLKNDDLFVLWFLRAYIVNNLKEAADSIAGGSKDKGIDAVYIDDDARAVFIIQGKYREEINKKSENRADIISFVQLAEEIFDPENKRFKEFISDMLPEAADKLRKCRERLLKRKYKLWLYYITLGKCSHSIKKDANQILKHLSSRALIEFFDGKRIINLLRDYLDGVAPPIPSLDLEFEKGKGIEINGSLQRYDSRNNLDSWVFTMRGDKVGSLYQKTGRRIFARNIRGFLGTATPVNKAMVATLKTDPERFFYYNNGITMICDKAELRSRQGKDILHVNNPQIINGQQTTRTLQANPENAGHASVMVKVIQVPRDHNTKGNGFDTLVSQIVSGTNWQNAIKATDLMANDRRQIEIQRELRKLGYAYIRKRQTKKEIVETGVGKRFFEINKEDMALAVAGCDLDPIVPRSGKENLFKKEMYKQVFPNSNSHYYLSRYWLYRHVHLTYKRGTDQVYAKWIVLGLVWDKLSPLVNSKKKARVFRIASEMKKPEIVGYLRFAIEKAFIAGVRYYQKNRDKGQEARDFFRGKKGRDKEFRNFWNSSDNTSKRGFERYWKRFSHNLSEFDV